jgi:hypothetical protein
MREGGCKVQDPCGRVNSFDYFRLLLVSGQDPAMELATSRVSLVCDDSFVWVPLRCLPSHGLFLMVTRVGVMLGNVVVQEGDVQVTMSYALYREALLWIRRTHLSAYLSA